MRIKKKMMMKITNSNKTWKMRVNWTHQISQQHPMKLRLNINSINNSNSNSSSNYSIIEGNQCIRMKMKEGN